MHDRRARVRLATRLLLGIGVGAFVLLAVLSLLEPTSMGASHRLWDNPLAWVGALGMVVGLGWMVRISRGTRDEPSTWRSRDH